MNILNIGDKERKAQLAENKDIISCPMCHTELAVDNSDWKTSPATGKQFINCPWCGHHINRGVFGPNDVRTKLVNELADAFDVERVHTVMNLLNWKWYGIEGIPTEDDIRQKVRDLVMETLERRCPIATAGFATEYIPANEDSDEGVAIRFQLDSLCACINNDNEVEFY